MMLPKPARREPAPRKRIPRTVAPRKRSAKRASVEAKDIEWAATVKGLAGLHCERCFRPAAAPGYKLDAHHARSKRAWPAGRHLLKNGVALCRLQGTDWGCHPWAHRHPAEFREWLLSVRPECRVLWEVK